MDGLLVKANRIVIPTDMRHDCLETLHVPHLGQQKTLLQACTSVFWPGMAADIKALISNCSACQKFQSRQRPSEMNYKLHNHGHALLQTFLSMEVNYT